MIQVGIVGLGFGLQVHLPAFQRDPRCQIIGITSRNVEKTRSEAARLGIHSFSSLQEMLESSPIDIVAMAVPPQYQREMIELAIQHGKSVFCEKPLGCGSEQGVRLAKNLESQKLIHGINFEFPEISAWGEAKKIVETQKIGQPQSFQLSWNLQTLANRFEVMDSWKLHPEKGGGTLFNFVSHVFYYLEWLFGPINELICLMDESIRSAQGVHLLLRFQGVVSGSVTVTANSPGRSIHRLEVYGNQDSLIIENSTKDYMNGFGIKLGSEAEFKFFESSNGSSHDSINDSSRDGKPQDGRILAVGKMASRFLDAFEQKKSFTPSLFEGARVEFLLEKAIQSNLSRQWVNTGL